MATKALKEKEKKKSEKVQVYLLGRFSVYFCSRLRNIFSLVLLSFLFAVTTCYTDYVRTSIGQHVPERPQSTNAPCKTEWTNSSYTRTACTHRAIVATPMRCCRSSIQFLFYYDVFVCVCVSFVLHFSFNGECCQMEFFTCTMENERHTHTHTSAYV